ncbi:MAG: T9SS type A sorting domain-containing protein [Bacteroidetes bacterium]|nr:T9SS type A sorting domain-containing protein [Bacteroidota bacterium]
MKQIFTSLFILVLFLRPFYLAAQIPNGDFENWSLDIDGNLNPDSWATLNGVPDTCVFQYTPAYSGNYSMRVATYDPGIGAQPGIAYVEFPYACRPTQIHVCVKTTIMSGDIGFVLMELHNGDSSIAAMDSCTFKFYTTTNTFQCFDFPISYISSLTPDSATVMIIAGNFLGAQLGTEIIVDELSFNCLTGIDETTIPVTATVGRNYPNPARDFTFLPLTLNKSSDVSIRVNDIFGKEVMWIDKGFMQAGENNLQMDVKSLANGIYFYSVSTGDLKIPGKFIVGN